MTARPPPAKWKRLLLDNPLSSDPPHPSDASALYAAAAGVADGDWDAVRRRLRADAPGALRAAAAHRGAHGTTALHVACRHRPPLDVVVGLLSAGPATAGWADEFGWLPLHYACANGASEACVLTLAETFPPSKVAVDARGRNPLHFALGHAARPATVATVVCLGATGAALVADENGRLPLHHACDNGALEEALRVLVDDNVETVDAADRHGLTPLHLALMHADRPDRPGIVALLLSRRPAAANAVDAGGNLPVHLLAARARTLKPDARDGRANCEACFGLYLGASPDATTDLLTGLQSLPEWLLTLAMMNPDVQSMLNVKISKRVPTMLIMVDLMFYIVVIFAYTQAVIDSVHDRNETSHDRHALALTAPLTMLYLAASWFLFREILQAWGLASLGLFHTWVSDWENWLDMIYIFVILIWSTVIATEAIEDITIFQNVSAIFVLPLTLVFLNSLKSKFFGFAVFLGGMTYVLKRLTAFLISVMIILVAFVFMFTTLFRQSEECEGSQTNPFSAKIQNQIGYSEVYEYDCTGDDLAQCFKNVTTCQPAIDTPFCGFLTAFTKILNMLGGEVDEANFVLGSATTRQLAQSYYVLFIFACVIVLANVLIAIVTDSWTVMQNERSVLVFWSNRLDFVAEIDLTLNKFMRTWKGDDEYLREKWTQIVYLLGDDVDEYGEDKLIVSNVVRTIAACVIMPLWVIVGLITFGALLPPQLREKMLTVRLTSKNEEQSAEQTRLEEVNVLREDIASFRADVTANIEKGKSDLYTIREILDTSQTEIQTEMNHVKELLSDMFDLLSPE